MWGVIIAPGVFWFVLWLLCGAPIPQRPTRDLKKQLKRQAKKKLCYGEIANIEYEVYGGIWTEPYTGRVYPLLITDLPKHLMACNSSRCNVHSRELYA